MIEIIIINIDLLDTPIIIFIFIIIMTHWHTWTNWSVFSAILCLPDKNATTVRMEVLASNSHFVFRLLTHKTIKIIFKEK